MTSHGLEHRLHPAVRWPEKRRHRQRTPSFGRRPSCHWHHFTNSGQRTPQQSRPLCRSRSPGRQTCGRIHIPRTPAHATLHTCHASHRSWWPLEPGNYNLPTVVGPSKARTILPRLTASFLLWSTAGQPNSPMQLRLPICGQPIGLWLRCERRHRRKWTSHQWSPGRGHLPAVSQPAPKEQWLGYTNGACLEVA